MFRMRIVLAFVFASLLFVLGIADRATAASVSVGDLVLAVQASPGAVYVMDPASGAATLVSSGGYIQAGLYDVAVGDSGIIYATTASGVQSYVVRIDPCNGAQYLWHTMASTSFNAPKIRRGPDHALYVGGGFAAAPKIVRLDPASGSESAVAVGTLPFAANFTWGADGTLWVIDGQDLWHVVGGVATKVNTVTLFAKPLCPSFDALGDMYVLSNSNNYIMKVNLANGTFTVAAGPASTHGMYEIREMPGSGLYVTRNQNGVNATMARFDPVTGTYTLIGSVPYPSAIVGFDIAQTSRCSSPATPSTFGRVKALYR